MYISRLASKDIKLGAAAAPAAAFKQDTFLDINRHTHTYLGTQKLFTLMTKLNAIKFFFCWQTQFCTTFSTNPSQKQTQKNKEKEEKNPKWRR